MPRRNNNNKSTILNEFNYCWPIFSAKYPSVPYPNVEVTLLPPEIGGMTIYTNPNRKITINVSIGSQSSEVIRHVIFHELCHLSHHNHSREFYDALDELDPLHQKRNGAYLEKRLQNLENLIEGIDLYYYQKRRKQ